MKKSFSILLLLVAIALIGCPKGPDTKVETPVSDTLVIDSTALDTVK